MTDQPAGFHVAAFTFDGELEGFGRWEFNKLSGKWLTICREHLAQHGNSFDVPWAGVLSHIQTKFTATSGVALAHFSANGKPVASVALATGRSPAAEAQVLMMFADSLRRVIVVRTAARSPEPFEKLPTLRERPIMAVVPWPSAVSQQDQDLVRELSLHLCAAFLSPNSA